MSMRDCKYIFKEAIGVDVALPLPRMPWQELMDRFVLTNRIHVSAWSFVDVKVVEGCGFSGTAHLKMAVLSVVSMQRTGWHAT